MALLAASASAREARMKDMNQRLFLAIAIWLACIFGYYTWFAPKKPPHPAVQTSAAEAESPKPAIQRRVSSDNSV